MVRVGVIGCGTMGKIHVRTLKRLGAEVVAVCDVDEAELRYAREALGVERTYRDYRDLIVLSDLDAVVIVTPNYLHHSMTVEALKEGKHVLCEKPPALTARQVKEMFDASERSGRALLIGLTFRFRKLSRVFRECVLRGDVGTPYLLKATMTRRSGIPGHGSWFTTKEMAGAGPLYDVGVHALDLAMWIANDFSAKEVMASTYAKLGPRGLGRGAWGKPVPGGPFTVEDWAVAFIRMESGATAVLEAGWAGHVSGDKFNVVVMGDRGGLDYSEASLYREEDGTLVDVKFKVGREEPLEEELKHFLRVVRGQEEPVTKRDEMILLQATLEAALKSAEEGRPVRVSEVLP